MVWNFVKKISVRVPTLLCRFDEDDLRKPKKDKENNLNKARKFFIKIAEKRSSLTLFIVKAANPDADAKKGIPLVERKFGFLMDSRWKDVPIEMVDGKEREHFQKFE